MTSNQFVLYAGAAIITIAALYYFIQWSHQIAKRNQLLEAQVKLLAKIAEKQGVSMDDIEVISRVAQ
jgi:hydrogenase-4 membrane subunit HyfE